MSQSDFSRQRLPSVRELAEQFGLSPNTANAALRILAERGVIRVVPRKGAFMIAANDHAKRTLKREDFASETSAI